ncbi:response regulator [Zobellia amurskyensis]|uniref:Response regulator n=1 Tax=Zobellia amurskyensis TaxID=248905 RepID=A0A7X2ZQL9_9FLAO|nr:response regulator [Zobellia amurskyensis]MUH34585.1 response regulator [Zobellia amurskyensis]
MKLNPIYLIVDDDEDDIDFFHEAMREVNASALCHFAYDGEEALSLLRYKLKMLPDLIFLDLNMPRMDGITCLRELKRDEKLRHIPVIINTTSAYQKEKEDCLILGAAYFLTKATSFRNMCENIIKVINIFSHSESS